MSRWLDQIAAACGDIHGALSLSRVLAALAHWTETLCQANTCLILHTPPDSNPAKLFARAKPHAQRLRAYPVSSAPGLLAWLQGNRKSLLDNHVAPDHPLFKNLPLPADMRGGHFMVTRITYQRQTLGLLLAANRQKQKSFSPPQLRSLERLATHAAQALFNARKFESQGKFSREQKRQLLSFTSQLRQANEKLRQSDVAKSEGISMVAHELRSPITSILGFSKILRDGKVGAISPEQTELFDIMYKNASALEHLISDLLDLTRMELGRLELKMTTLPCAELIEEAVFSVQGSTPPPERRIRLELPSDSLRVKGDRARLRQVLVNLLSNAMKYTPAGSPILVRLEYRQHRVIFSVEDRGTPFTPEQQEKIFEKFYRLKQQRGKTISGSGLGLAICRIMVDNHGGRLWTETVPSGGNRFCFELNRA